MLAGRIAKTSAKPGTTPVAHHVRPVVQQTPMLPRAVGSQTATLADQRHWFAGNHSAASEVAAGLSWDFSSTPVFSPNSLVRSGRASALAPVPRFGTLQAKLEIGSADNPLEHEADRAAHQVAGLPEHTAVSSRGSLMDPDARSGHGGERLQTHPAAAGGSGQTAAPPIVHDALRSPWRPLDPGTRAFMGARFGVDFSQVRVHADEEAAVAARAVRARAFTVGRDIVFAPGQYAPATQAGRRLLAHELTHVVQQASGAQTVLSRDPDDQGKGKESKEQKEAEERDKLLTEFTDGAGLSDKQVRRIRSAMNDFSLHQLHAMQKAGLRFWPGDSLPPEFQGRVEVKRISTPAEYLDVIRVIRMAENASTDAIRHEMAHAWDHVRTGKVKSVHNLKDKEFQKVLGSTPELSSATAEKRETREVVQGKSRTVKIPISEMLKRYRKSAPLREWSFDNPTTQEGYSKKSEREFYAEGYSVFHGGCETCQARLLYFAPELYELLENESKQEGLPVPDRSKLEDSIKEQKLPPRD